MENTINPNRENTQPTEIDPILADTIKEHWPYSDFTYEEWVDNGSLITSEGLPSKLDRELYNLVRSDEFKDWFGDWENVGAEGISTFIDTLTGEPQVFYRGDKSRFKDGYKVKTETERTLDPAQSYNYSERQVIAGARSQGVFLPIVRKWL